MNGICSRLALHQQGEACSQLRSVPKCRTLNGPGRLHLRRPSGTRNEDDPEHGDLQRSQSRRSRCPYRIGLMRPEMADEGLPKALRALKALRKLSVLTKKRSLFSSSNDRACFYDKSKGTDRPIIPWSTPSCVEPTSPAPQSIWLWGGMRHPDASRDGMARARARQRARGSGAPGSIVPTGQRDRLTLDQTRFEVAALRPADLVNASFAYPSAQSGSRSIAHHLGLPVTGRDVLGTTRAMGRDAFSGRLRVGWYADGRSAIGEDVPGILL